MKKTKAVFGVAILSLLMLSSMSSAARAVVVKHMNLAEMTGAAGCVFSGECIGKERV